MPPYPDPYPQDADGPIIWNTFLSNITSPPPSPPPSPPQPSRPQPLQLLASRIPPRFFAQCVTTENLCYEDKCDKFMEDHLNSYKHG